jgi:hypothetical protein
VDFRAMETNHGQTSHPGKLFFMSKMAKDIESGEPIGTSVSRGHVPRHEHGTKVYPDGMRNRKNYNLFLDAVWLPIGYWVRCMGSRLR